jgi:hypothetical protein
MKQNKNDSKHSDDNLAVEPNTLCRLMEVQMDNETPDDTLTRLLDDAIEHVPIETVLTDLLDEFENPAGVDVNMAVREGEPGLLLIIVYADRWGWEKHFTLYEGTEARAVIESEEGEEFHQPFDIRTAPAATMGKTPPTSPVYMADDIDGFDPLALEDGLDQLRAKVGKSPDEPL